MGDCVTLSYSKDKLIDYNICENYDNLRNLKSFFDNNGYKLIHINNFKNSINGTIQKGSSKWFFKVVSHSDAINELNGYNIVSTKFPVPSLHRVYKFYDKTIMEFDYDENIKENAGLLNDYIVDGELKHSQIDWSVIDKIIEKYKNSFFNVSLLSEYPMCVFFKSRVNSRLTDWYKDDKLFEYRFVVNEIACIKTNSIVDKIKSYFSKNKKLECSITQGDPNLLNIGVKPIWFDCATGGYNPIVAEFSTFLWSVLIADMYFCPKYHKQSYTGHEKIYSLLKQYDSNIKINVDDKKKIIYSSVDIVTSQIRKDIVLKYIDMLSDLNLNLDDFIYFLAMRILCVFNIRKFEKRDYFYILSILHLFFYELNNNNNIIAAIKETIDMFTQINCYKGEICDERGKG